MLQLVGRIRQFQDQRLGIESQLSSIELRMELELAYRLLYKVTLDYFISLAVLMTQYT